MIDQNRSSKERFRRMDCFQSDEEKWPIEVVVVEGEHYNSRPTGSLTLVSMIGNLLDNNYYLEAYRLSITQLVG